MQKTGLIISLGLLALYLFESKQNAQVDKGEIAKDEELLRYGENAEMQGVKVDPTLLIRIKKGVVYCKLSIDFSNSSNNNYWIGTIKADPKLYNLPIDYRTKKGVPQWNDKYAKLEIPSGESVYFEFDYEGEVNDIKEYQIKNLERELQYPTNRYAETNILISWTTYDPKTGRVSSDAKKEWNLLKVPTWITEY